MVQLFCGGGGSRVKLAIPYRNPYNLCFLQGFWGPNHLPLLELKLH